MGFYSFLLFLELVDRLTSIVFRFLYLLAYAVIASYIFYAIEYGYSNLINNNLLYRPEKTLHFVYLYIKWWYAHRQQVGFRETFPLLLAICAPYLLYISVRYAFFAIKNLLQRKICTALKLPLPKKLQAKLQQKQKNINNHNQHNNERIDQNQPTDNSRPEQ